MTSRSGTDRPVITDRLVRLVANRLSESKRVRRSLPEQGRLHIDRPLPFLCVYRRPARTDAGTDRLVTSEPSYLIASAKATFAPGLRKLVTAIAGTLGEQFGAFLIVEVWADHQPAGDTPNPIVTGQPEFTVLHPKADDLGPMLDVFEETLARIAVRRLRATVQLTAATRPGPPRTAPLLTAAAAKELRTSVLGLKVRPIYQHPEGGETYPLVLRELRRGLSRAMKRTFFEFTRKHTTQRPSHYHVLGRHAVVKAVWEVDKELAAVADSFDFLLQLSPVNTADAWHEFQRVEYARAPTFHYRPLPVDPAILKRRLYHVPLERVEDPALAQLFRGKQDELDRQLTMLYDVNTPRFVHGSIQLYGAVDDDLVRLAEDLLEYLPPRTREDSKAGHLNAMAFAQRAQEEIAYYREKWPQVNGGVHIRGDIASGLMVSRGSLLIGEQTRIPSARADALLQHEIGTHLVTYYNGRAQPFRQLYSGLAGYESLQEGLAVLAEYLVGGLSRPRLRLLAARVVAARHLCDGASFVETFRELEHGHAFDRRTAFTVTMRVYRGGGLTKDAVYLRGLHDILAYFGRGGAIEPLFVGKIAAEHIPLLRELRWRDVLREPPLLPRYLEREDVGTRLTQLRRGVGVLQLIKGGRR